MNKMNMLKLFGVGLILSLVLAFNQGYLTMNNTESLVKEKKQYNGVVASIVPIDEDTYIICDYVNLCIFDPKKNSIAKIEITNFDGSLNPAGMFYDHKNKKLYVANYTKKNVLVFDYLESNKSLKFSNYINSDLFKGPEDVFVENGQLLVADYDGSLVLSFDISKAEPTLNWATNVAQAHSVIKLNGEIFATSLTDRKIYKISDSGAITASTVGMGNKPPGHLWPVHLFATHNKELGVVDAHQGSVSQYNNKLELKSTFGKNGPLESNFNFPYSVSTTASGYVMADSFRKRIVFYDKDFSNPKTIKYGSGLEKVYMEKSKLSQDPEVDDISYLYDYPDDCRLFFEKFNLSKFIDTDTIYPSFNGFASKINNKIFKQFRIDSPVNIDGTFFDANNFYMTGCKKINNKQGEFYVFYSPQNPTVILIDPTTWAVIYAFLSKSDMWGDEVVAEVLRSCKNEFDAFIQIRELIKQGVPRVDAYKMAVLEELYLKQKGSPYKEVKMFWNKAFSLSGIKEKLSDSLTKIANQDNINEYVLSSMGKREINLIETLFISYVLGKSIFENIADLEIESKLPYYVGYELINALNYKDESVYASALEHESDYVFTIKGNVSNGQLVIDWMPEHVPEKLTVTVYNKAGQVIDVLLTSEVKKVDLSDFQYKDAVKLKINCHYSNKDQRLLIKRLVFLNNIFHPIFNINSNINKKYSYTYDYSGPPIEYKNFRKKCRGHCGHYATALSQALEEEGYKTIIYNIKGGEAIHTVVEVYDASGSFIATLDPTLDVGYLAKLEYFVKGKTNLNLPGVVVGKGDLPPRLIPYLLTVMGQSDLSVRKKYDGFKSVEKAF